MNAIIKPLPSVAAALKTLDRLEMEVRCAPSFEALDLAARTAAAIQQTFRPVKDVADKAGSVWIAADIRLAEELEKLGKAKGGRPRKTGAESEPVIAPTLAELGVDKKRASRAKRLKAIPEAAREEFKKELADEGKGVTPAAVLKKQAEADRAEKRRVYAAVASTSSAERSIDGMVRARKKFAVIYADPPWEFKVYSGKGKERSAERHYDTMSLDAIAALPIAKLAGDDCALLLWSVWPELPGALHIIEKWGFQYKTAAFVWVKQNRGGAGLFTGMGYWTRANSEPCLLATKGSPTRLAMDVHQVILAPVAEHSRKPEEAHKRIERLLPGPRLEIFARQPRDGWTTWGNEVTREAAE